MIDQARKYDMAGVTEADVAETGVTAAGVTKMGVTAAVMATVVQ